MKFESQYLGLSILMGEKIIQFMNGQYETLDKDEIATLKNAVDAVEVKEEKEAK